jgi:hypothetical protein
MNLEFIDRSSLYFFIVANNFYLDIFAESDGGMVTWEYKFSTEDGDSMFLQNAGIYRWVYTVPKPRITSLFSIKFLFFLSMFMLNCFHLL